MKSKPNPKVRLEPSTAKLRAEQLYQLWLICNIDQRSDWLASLSDEDVGLLHAYRASLPAQEREPNE